MLSLRFHVGPVKLGTHDRSHPGPPTVQTRFTSHNIKRVAEEMLGTTTWPGATRNTHRNATTDQGLHHCADSFLATLNDLLRVLRDQFCAHQRQLRRIVAIVFVLQLVSKLSVLHSAKLRNNMAAA